MQFTTIEFLLFFVLFFGVYWSLKKRLLAQNVWILVAGCVFYGWWDWRFLGLIVFTVISTWGCGLLAVKGHRRSWTVVNVVVNVGILFAFKYCGFFAENLRLLLNTFGWNVDWFTIDVLLPVGISFYTFQAIGYSIDVYRGDQVPERNLVSFATFIMFFPQLLAGPIERASQLLPQVNNERRWNYTLAVDGARELLWGLFKKIAVADVCGSYVDTVCSQPDVAVWKLAVVSVLFLLQIYCDFSGYCNMARGMAAMLGFRLSVNFRYPLFSRNVAEFWHRWHITFMSWMRDYIYIPLGGSRRGLVRTCINIMAVFLLSGLWHGASWNFVVWGLMWGLLMICGRIVGQRRYRLADVVGTNPVELLKVVAMCYVSVLIFIFFRFPDVTVSTMVVLHTAGYTMVGFLALWGILLLGRLIGKGAWKLLPAIGCLFVAMAWVTVGAGHALAFMIIGIFPTSILTVLAVEWKGRMNDHALVGLQDLNTWKRYSVYWLLILFIILSNSAGQRFIYYQF